jgi:ribonucleotide monophosphatase NagD (HAD superfamily)
VTAAIEACTGTTAVATLGKPDAAILDTALDGLDVAARDCLVVGDRLATDIRLGRGAGMPTALVLTGETGPEALAGADPHEAPEYVLDRVDRVLPAAEWRRLGWPEE